MRRRRREFSINEGKMLLPVNCKSYAIMKAAERRKSIALRLSSEKEAISGSALADIYGVSRQIIVGDIAVLKGSGYDILSTHSGYVLRKSPHAERVLKLKHTVDETEEELSLIISNCGIVYDVFVRHKVYGKIAATLNIFSQHGVDKFIDDIRSGKSVELMNITGGYHYHTIRADSEEILDRIEALLAERGYLVSESDE